VTDGRTDVQTDRLPLAIARSNYDRRAQWLRQDLLRGGAKMKIMSWGTHGGLQGRVKQLLDN